VHAVGDSNDSVQSLQPRVLEGTFVVVSDVELNDDVVVFATVREREGVSFVIGRHDADRLNLNYDFLASWITLELNSNLASVGLTALFSHHLTQAGIGCNVLAGYHHDHLLVPHERVHEAVALLEALRF
jgi:hypothetical protein